MNVFEEIFPVSKRTKCLIFMCSDLILSTLLAALNLWSVIRWQEKIEKSSTEVIETSHYLEEQFTHIPTKRLQMIEKIFIFMLIFHVQGILLNIFLLYAILKIKYRFFIMWILANSLKAFCLSALLFFLSAVFMSLGVRRYQVLAITALFVAGVYGYLHYKFSKCVYSLYVSVKNDSLSRMRAKRSQSKETIVDSNPTLSSYGTGNIAGPQDGEETLSAVTESQIHA